MQPLEILEPALDVPKVGRFQKVHDVRTAKDRFFTFLGVGADFDADGLAGLKNALVEFGDGVFFEELVIDLGGCVERIAFLVVRLKERLLHLAQFLVLLQLLLLLILLHAKDLHFTVLFFPPHALHLSLGLLVAFEPVHNGDEFLHGVGFQIDALFLLDVLLKHLWIVISLDDLNEEVILLGFEVHTISRD